MSNPTDGGDGGHAGVHQDVALSQRILRFVSLAPASHCRFARVTDKHGALRLVGKYCRILQNTGIASGHLEPIRSYCEMA
jgi:hypothetical protein